MKKVRKLIIPAAGWGTRFLPFTKIVHKELLPILNKPAISYLVEEAQKAGIEEIYLVLAERKQEVFNYFDRNKSLEYELKDKNKISLLKEVRKTNLSKTIKVIIQEHQYGLGHAIATVADYLEDEPVAVILGDDLIYSEEPAIGQLIKEYEKRQSTIIGVQDVELNETNKYGVVKPLNEDDKDNKIFKIVDGIEKPEPSKAPSTKAIMGRYVFTPEFITVLKNQEYKGEEIQVVDAFEEILKTQNIYALTFDGIRYDLGGTSGFVKANIDYALRDATIGTDILKFIRKK